MSIAARRISAAQSVKDEGNYLRRIIRRNRGKVLTNSEIKVLVALVNLWLYHRNGPKGYIHPGREELAKKTAVHSKTVSRSLDKFRSLGIAVPLKHLSGGNGRSTQYRIDTAAIEAVFAPSNVVPIDGTLIPFRGTVEGAKCPTTQSENVPQQPGQNVPLSIGMETTSPDRVESAAPTTSVCADLEAGNLLRKGRARPEASASPSKPATSEILKSRMKGSAA